MATAAIALAPMAAAACSDDAPEDSALCKTARSAEGDALTEADADLERRLAVLRALRSDAPEELDEPLETLVQATQDLIDAAGDPTAQLRIVEHASASAAAVEEHLTTVCGIAGVRTL